MTVPAAPPATVTVTRTGRHAAGARPTELQCRASTEPVGEREQFPAAGAKKMEWKPRSASVLLMMAYESPAWE